MKIGTVPYINGLPLSHFLKQDTIKLPPAQLISALLNDEIDVGLIPVYSILKHNLHMHPDAGIIGCNGAVQSVGLFTRSYINDISEIRSLYMDTESQSSVYLTKIILKTFFDVSLYDVEFFHRDNKDRADAQLLIGDKALFYKDELKKFWDLGQVWQENTNTGFMFACWASKRKLTTEELNELICAKELGLSKRAEFAASFGPEHEKMLYDYLNHKICYEPSPAIKEGFKLYHDNLSRYGYIEKERKVA